MGGSAKDWDCGAALLFQLVQAPAQQMVGAGERKGAKKMPVVKYPVSKDGGSGVTSLPLPFCATKDGLQIYGVGEDEPGACGAVENCRALSLRLEERR